MREEYVGGGELRWRFGWLGWPAGHDVAGLMRVLAPRL
jgi:hypothetical protein